MKRPHLAFCLILGCSLVAARSVAAKSPLEYFKGSGAQQEKESGDGKSAHKSDEKKSDGKKSGGKNSLDDEDSDDFSTTVETPMIGDYTTVAGLNVIELTGVGLVTGLDGTGGDPPPSMYRTEMLEEMKRRGIANPNLILRSPNTALVLVRAYLPPLIRKGEPFDVEVRALGNDETTSLNGGWLMETYLSEEAIVPGRGKLVGHDFGKARGPIMVSTGEGSKESNKAVVTRGKVLGGGVSLKDRDLALYLRNDFRSVRNSKRIADRIGLRFFNYNEHGLRDSLAEAKTDQKVDLKLLPRYKENYPRYLQVIRHIAFREKEVEQRVRMQKLKQRLLDPASAEKAAIELEALGSVAVPILKTALKDKNLEVRFHAAMALAYLGEPDGLPTLAEAAREEPAFRIFAYAAMSAIDDAQSSQLLRKLLSETSSETRYGAFRAMTTLDKNDPFVHGERLNDQFQFHVLPVEGPPMIHMTNRRKAEVVLFGTEQEFRTPMAVRAGTKILVTGAAGTNQVVVSRFEVGKPDRREVVSTRVADVIRKVAEFGATYPDVAQLLAQADRQQNAPGPIEIDAIPKAGRYYERPVAGSDGTKKRKVRISNPGNAPNIFAEDKDFNPTGAPGKKGPLGPQTPGDKKEAAEKSAGDLVKADSESKSRAVKSDSKIQQVKAEFTAEPDEAEVEPAPASSKKGRSTGPARTEPARIEKSDKVEKTEKAERGFNFFNPFRKTKPNQIEPESLDD